MSFLPRCSPKAVVIALATATGVLVFGFIHCSIPGAKSILHHGMPSCLAALALTVSVTLLVIYKDKHGQHLRDGACNRLDF